MIAQFRTPLRFEDHGGLPLTLIDTLVYDSALLKGTVYVPAGFKTDLASIPRGLWNIFPKLGTYDAAAVTHDWLYHAGTYVWVSGIGHIDRVETTHTETLTREQADKVFLEAMEVSGVGWFTRRTLYLAVRLGGGGTWNRYREVAGV